MHAAACAHRDWAVECGRALHIHARLQIGGIMILVRHMCIVRVPLGLLLQNQRACVPLKTPIANPMQNALLLLPASQSQLMPSSYACCAHHALNLS